MARLLLIDDEEEILNSLSKALSFLGYSVKVALDGEQGIRLFDQGGSFDCVVTGIHMPRMSGNEVARYIRNSLKPDTPVVAMTGSEEEAIDKEFFNSYLIKPFRLKSLIDLIGKLKNSN
jgi:two-component system cell cycle sensor histidine kinase/response regulator CckA